jgi:hypothetical protein
MAAPHECPGPDARNNYEDVDAEPEPLKEEE